MDTMYFVLFKEVGDMSRRFLIVAVALLFAGMVGCTNVQKGAAAGGAVGSAVGAAWGTTTPLRGGPGALIGLGAGGLAGAVAGDYYYEDEASKLEEPPPEELSRLQNQLASARQRQQELQQETSSLQQELQAKKSQQQALLEANEKARQKLNELRQKLNSTSSTGDIAVSQNSEGITLTILSEVLFDSGKATLKSGGKDALSEAARIIKNQFSNEEIEIRGHTDNVPIRYSNYKSNWELSAARALSVLHYMIEQEGLSPKRLHAAGYGKTRPVASNDTSEGRSKNRRAEILIRTSDVSVTER